MATLALVGAFSLFMNDSIVFEQNTPIFWFDVSESNDIAICGASNELIIVSGKTTKRYVIPGCKQIGAVSFIGKELFLIPRYGSTSALLNASNGNVEELQLFSAFQVVPSGKDSCLLMGAGVIGLARKDPLKLIRQRQISKKGVSFLALKNDAEETILLTNGNKVVIWTFGDGRRRTVFTAKGPINSIEWSPRPEVLGICASGGSCLLDNNYAVVLSIDHDRGAIGKFSRDGHLFCLGTPTGELILIDVRRRQMIAKRKVHMRTITCLQFSPDSQFIYSSSFNGTLAKTPVALLLSGK